jgi:hypothetical protein
VILFFIVRGISRKEEISIRKIPAIDAIDEAVGRATEMGRPIHFASGLQARLSEQTAMDTLAGLNVLRLLAQKAASYGTRLICTIANAELQAITEDIVRTAYTAADRADLYTADTVRYVSDNQQAYIAGAQSLLVRENVGSNILAGYWTYEGWPLAETGAAIGAFQIGGCTRMATTSVFVTTCDYVFLGEELFVTGAYLSKNPALLGSTQGQDVSKLLIVGLVVVLALLATLGSSWLSQLLRI